MYTSHHRLATGQQRRQCSLLDCIHRQIIEVFDRNPCANICTDVTRKRGEEMGDI